MNEATSAGGRSPEHPACRPRGGWGFAQSGRQAVSGRPAKRKRVEACSFEHPDEHSIAVLQGDTTPGLGTPRRGVAICSPSFAGGGSQPPSSFPYSGHKSS